MKCKVEGRQEVIKKVRVLFSVICAGVLVVNAAIASQKPVQEIRGLARFNSASSLEVLSEKDIKSVRIGDNVLNVAAKLQEDGGEIHYISGGSRSRNVKISFYQPYQDATLNQQFKLNFNKDNGFIHLVEVTYKLDSAYLDMQPVYDKIVENAVKKYGNPLMMSEVRSIVSQAQNNVLVRQFADSLAVDAEVQDKVRAFFEDKIITSRTQFVESGDGRAMLISGFNECYLWPSERYKEILSLCALRKSKVNMKGQTVKMDLHNFSIETQIENYREPTSDEVEISL